ncbi:unnamed protein product [Sphenostylis stenocarpa]|uniref:Uncharacterized protein n=1 Tax=Sphenostylis stenocarpa TaxID=92480 RepID=A0AA86RYT0_9FABA|nr:unnamed protein product [Sphenostylis stenocarpa]
MESLSGGGSFKNFGTGPQNFEDSNIKSDSCACIYNSTGSNDTVVYHGGGGPQNFQDARINGVKVESPSSPGSPTTSSDIHWNS